MKTEDQFLAYAEGHFLAYDLLIAHALALAMGDHDRPRETLAGLLLETEGMVGGAARQAGNDATVEQARRMTDEARDTILRVGKLADAALSAMGQDQDHHS